MEIRYECKVVCQAIGPGNSLLAQGEHPLDLEASAGSIRDAAREARLVCARRLEKGPLDAAIAHRLEERVP